MKTKSSLPTAFVLKALLIIECITAELLQWFGFAFYWQTNRNNLYKSLNHLLQKN